MIASVKLLMRTRKMGNDFDAWVALDEPESYNYSRSA